MTIQAWFSRSSLEDALRGMVALGSALDSRWVIPQNDNGPEPSGPYATVLLMGSRQIGYPARHVLAGAPETEYLRFEVRADYSIQWYRADAMLRADRFQHWFQSSQGLLDAEAAGFTLQGLTSIRRIDWMRSTNAAGDSEWEERAALDLEIGYWQISIHDADYFERTRIHTLDLDSDGIVHRETIDVDASGS